MGTSRFFNGDQGNILRKSEEFSGNIQGLFGTGAIFEKFLETMEHRRRPPIAKSEIANKMSLANMCYRMCYVYGNLETTFVTNSHKSLPYISPNYDIASIRTSID